MAKSDWTEFTKAVIRTIKSIPEGRVITYGGAAAVAGSPGAARTVAWILHSTSRKEHLPWHRVINSRGSISLKPGYGFELQKQLLKSEGVVVGENGTVSLKKYLWIPE